MTVEASVNVNRLDHRDPWLNNLTELEAELNRKNMLTLDLTVNMVGTGAFPITVASDNSVETVTRLRLNMIAVAS